MKRFMQYREIIKKLKSLSNPENVVGMTKFGINPHNTLGISVYIIRDIAKKIGKNHELAQQLWDSKIHEARLLAGFIDEPKRVSEKQMEKWVNDFDSWDVCDQICSNLFDKTPFVYKKVFDWSKREKEFVKRAGFVLIAALAVHDKQVKDEKFEQFFPIIKKCSTDERNFVKKAVNWALRQIGKRNLNLNRKAIKIAGEIQRINSKSARWIANDAIREITNEKVQRRLRMAKKL